MATESGFITLENLKRQPEDISFEGKEKTKFLTQGWKMVQENEVRKLKLAAEAEERKLAAEAAVREAERKHKLQMEKLRLESERLNRQRSVSSVDQQAALSQASQNTVARTKAPVLSGFVDGKDNLDSYTCFALKDMPLLQAGNDLTGLLVSAHYCQAERWMSTTDCQTNKQGIMISYRRLFYRGMTSGNRVTVKDSEKLSRRDRNLLVSSL